MQLSNSDIEHLYSAAVAGSAPARDAALIRAALYWGFTATELSSLQIAHVLDINGNWREKFLVPAGFGFNGLARSAWLRDPQMIEALDAWLDERNEKGWDCIEGKRYRGFDGKAPLFLNNQGKPFAMTPRAPGSDDLLPSGMHRQLRELLDRAGLPDKSPQVFRDTYIVQLWIRGLTRQQISQLTGIRKAETITRKIRHLLPEPADVFRDFLYRPVPQDASVRIEKE
ncbi:MAG: hypothetical protein KY410_08340 [Proteobacteria bacterium]|nr:hypothetical protein [Pseudomonadota bacterium]